MAIISDSDCTKAGGVKLGVKCCPKGTEVLVDSFYGVLVDSDSYCFNSKLKSEFPIRVDGVNDKIGSYNLVKHAQLQYYFVYRMQITLEETKKITNDATSVFSEPKEYVNKKVCEVVLGNNWKTNNCGKWTGFFYRSSNWYFYGKRFGSYP
jgi:hypothetical protein